MRITHQSFSAALQDDQNLSVEEAAMRLANEQSVLAAGFPDLTEDELYDAYPEPVLLSPSDFQGLRLKQVIRHLQGYERFAVYP